MRRAYAVLIPGLTPGSLVLASTHETEADARAAALVLAHDRIRGALVVPRLPCDCCGFPVTLYPLRVSRFVRCALCVADFDERAEKRAIAEGLAELSREGVDHGHP